MKIMHCHMPDRVSFFISRTSHFLRFWGGLEIGITRNLHHCLNKYVGLINVGIKLIGSYISRNHKHYSILYL